MHQYLKEVFKNYQILIISIFIYLASVFFIAPWGNYAVGDDLYYFVQIQGFNSGSYIKNGHIDTAIVYQILIGQVWSQIFGLSFISLRILSIIFTLFIILGLFKILQILNVNKFLSLISIFLIIFNPKVFHSSLSFNSEIYFIFFILWGFYYLLKYEKSESWKFLIYSVIFSGLSVGVRQVGILFILVYVLFAFVKYRNFKNIYVNKNKFIIPLVIFLSIAAIGIFWPKQVSDFQENSKSLLAVIDFAFVSDKFYNLWQEIPYLSLILFPFLLLFIKDLNFKNRLILIIPALVLGVIFTKSNVFSIGNTFYLEGMDARSYTVLREHLFNNLLIKIIFSVFLSYVFLGSLLFIYSKIEIIKTNKISLILFFTSLVFLSSTLLAQTSYDRYFIYFEIFFVLGISTILNRFFIKSIFYYISVLFLIFFTTFYQTDYHQNMKLKWELAQQITIDRNLKPLDTYVNETYLKFNYISKINDFKGIRSFKPKYYEYQCFTINGVSESKSFIRGLVDAIDYYLLKINFFHDISIEGYGYAKSQIKNCNNCKVLYQKYYFSPMYELYGKSKYVKVYCLNEFK